MFRKLIALAALAAAPILAAEDSKPVSVADGVWGMQTPGLANAGWFTFGDSVIAVDSGKTPEDAKLLLAAIEKTTGKSRVSMLILTNDFVPHAGGAAEFIRRGATIVCQEKAGAEAMALITRVAAEQPRKSSDRPIVLSTDRRLVLADGARRVEIAYAGDADSGVDLVVYLPIEKVLFSGDLAVSGVLPLFYSKKLDPDGWLKAVGHLKALNAGHLVPGFGKIGPVDGLDWTGAYLTEALEIARKVAAEKTPNRFLETRFAEPDVQMRDVPKELIEVHGKNMVALVERLRGGKDAPTSPAKN